MRPEEEWAQLHLVSEGQRKLFDTLQQLKGITIDHSYRLENLFAVGGQGILWAGIDLNIPERAVLVRMAKLPYHRPAYISEEDIQLARQHIHTEARLLRLFGGQYFPQFYDLVHGPSPLYPVEFGEQVIAEEVYLIMEQIKGITLAQSTKMYHQPPVHWEPVITLTLSVAQELLKFFKYLRHTTCGWLYTDLKPKNLLFPKQGKVILRVLDVGSVIPINPDPTLSIPFSWEYIPPQYYEVYQNGIWTWPDQRFVLYELGKLLWQIITNRHPMPSEDPDLSLLDAAQCPQDFQRFIVALIHQRFADLDSASQAFQDVSRLGMIEQ
jgi:serine/threonine protein kinase